MTEIRTTLDPYKKEYEEVLSLTGLKHDPFPLISPNIVTYWADNKELLKLLKETILDSLLFASSNIYVFYGKIGVGKTFAANYLFGSEGIKLLSKEIPNFVIKKQYVLKIRAAIPRKSGELLNSVYNGIVKKIIEDILKDDDLTIELKEVYRNIPMGNIRRAFNEISKDLHKTTLIRTPISLDNNEGFKYITDEKNKFGKLRDINDLGTTLLYLISILFKKYEKISIIIDELEHLSQSTVSERYQFSDLIKCLYEFVDIGLNIIFIYTFETYDEVSTTLQPAILDRVKDKILFRLIDNEADVCEYIYYCIEDRGEKAPDDFIEELVIEKFSKKLINNFKQISFRDINKEMHKFISLCYRIRTEQRDFNITKFKITNELYTIYENIKK